jgi:hypothetical protein
MESIINFVRDNIYSKYQGVICDGWNNGLDTVAVYNMMTNTGFVENEDYFVYKYFDAPVGECWTLFYRTNSGDFSRVRRCTPLQPMASITNQDIFRCEGRYGTKLPHMTTLSNGVLLKGDNHCEEYVYTFRKV